MFLICCYCAVVAVNVDVVIYVILPMQVRGYVNGHGVHISESAVALSM